MADDSRLLLPPGNMPVLYDTDDPLDPRNWADLAASSPTRCLYLSDRDSSIHALVDEIDWDWINATRWMAKNDGRTKWYVARKIYTSVGRKNRTCRSIYLHIEVMRRIAPQPDEEHCLVDHIDGNGLNCTRDNLRWVTPAMNSRNLWGFAFSQK